ncbi:MAG: hypothetical protein EAX96_02410 [Candidatus Lokiarchaeota archaeon]|nr:hypothetical protein [Candidatus Lokiarchaeota archaeon]
MGLEDISDLIERFYKYLGYKTKFLEDGLLEISPPLDISKKIEITDKDLVITKPIQLAFNLKVARSHNIELITFESPTLNKIIEYIEKLGKIGKAFIPFNLPDKGNIIQYLEKSESKIKINSCNYEFLDFDIVYSPFIVFDFLISFKSLEKNEILDTQIIPVNESDRNDIYVKYIRDQLSEKYPLFSESPSYPGKIFKVNEKQLKAIYSHALQRAELAVQENESEFNNKIEKRLKKEIDLLNTFYKTRAEEIIKDIDRKRKLKEDEFKTDNYKFKKEKQIEELEIDLKRFTYERERKLNELKNTYSTETEYQLESVGILYSPIEVLLNFNINSKYGNFVVGLQYDYAHQILFPFRCNCGNILMDMSLNVCSTLHLCCNECLDSCNECNTNLCRSCGKFCNDCNELYCNNHIKNHFDICQVCNSLICKKKLEECYNCAKIACLDKCLVTCIVCEKNFCVNCVERCEICHQPTCFQHKYTCEKCKKNICKNDFLECSSCGKTSCNECMDKCYICSLKSKNLNDYNTLDKGICNECKIICKVCKEVICQDHSHYCKNCGKAICDRHLVQCEHCHEYFCEDCLITCSECGKRICSQCVKVCEISNETLCQEHVARCFYCSKIVKRSILNTCLCGKSICLGCSMKCDYCREILCKNCVKFCNYCHKPFCINHINECQICGALTCLYHFKGNIKGHTKFCIYGYELICNDCVRACSNCGIETCKHHMYTCSKCGNLICNNCMEKCKICKKIICNSDTIYCSYCGGSFCWEHIQRCEICTNYCCENDFLKCSSCEEISCKLHFPSMWKKSCSTCNNLNEIESNLNFEIQNDKYLEEIKLISHWEFGTNPLYKVIKGRTSKYEIIIVVNKKNNEQKIIKRDTLLGKIVKKIPKFKKNKDNSPSSKDETSN